MKRDEFLIGASLYALVIVAGFCNPFLKKMEKIPWNLPDGAFIHSFLSPPASPAVPKARQTRFARKTRKALAPAGRPDSPLADIRQTLDENWKKMISNPALLGKNLDQAGIHSLAGKKTGMKSTPVIPERRIPHVDEPPKS